MSESAHLTSLIEVTVRSATPGVFPFGRFEHLLTAATSSTKAVEAWATYVDSLPATEVGIGETRLYPLVLGQLKAAGHPSSDPRLLSARRTAVVQSELTIRAAEHVNDLFSNRGIDLVFSKGIALQVTEYRNPVLRTFSDIDCCIRLEDVDHVMKIAAEEGWYIPPELVPGNRHVFQAHKEVTFQLPSGVCLDVHWVPRRALTFQPSLIENFFLTAEVAVWRGRSWKVPSATWRLYETIEHGTLANIVAPIRWVADALRIIENPQNDIDWNFLQSVVATLKLNLVFCAAFSQISRFSEQFDANASLQNQEAIGWLEKREFMVRACLETTARERLRDEFFHYFQRAPGSIIARIIRFPNFLVQGAGRSENLKSLLTQVWQRRVARSQSVKQDN